MIARRNLLRAAGVSLALPALRSLGAPAPATPPRRMVAINIPLGFHSPNFFPTDTGPAYTPSPYLGLAGEVREHFTVISGTSHPDVDGGHSADKTFLTAAPHPAARGFKNTISLDQLVAGEVGDATRFASLTLGSAKISSTANGVPIPPIWTPKDAFAKLFLTEAGWQREREEKRIADGQSILDTVLDEARSTQAKASPADRAKLDQFFTAVRETETRLQKSEQWLATPKPQVDAEPPPDVQPKDLVTWFRSFLDVIRLAVQTDSTRVVAFGSSDHGQVIPLPGVSMGYHALTHHGKNPEMIKQLETIERETIVAWAEFIAALQAVPEGDGTLLDHTQVLVGSNLGNASGHLTTNLPILLAGGGFKHGQHLAFDQQNNEALPKLFVSMLQKLGLEHDRFAHTTGTLTGLS